MLAAGLAVIAVLTVRNRFDDPDLWFHLRLGQVVWTSHSIPSTDTFSFTAQGHAWTAHEWLAQLAIYATYRAGGYAGLMVWLASLASLLFVLVYFLCYQRSGNALAAFLGGLCAWLFATVGLAIRPLLLGHIFLVVELILLDRAARNRRWLWLIPPLFAVWVNCHGSYFFGLGVLAVYWLCSFARGNWGLVVAEGMDQRQRRDLGVVLMASVAALCVNPIGWRLLVYPLDTLFHQPTNLHSVEEWFPPDLGSGRTLAMIAALIGIPAIAALRRLELPLRSMLVLAAGTALALQHVRMLFLFGIVLSPVLAEVVAPLLGRDRQRDHPAANGMFLCAFLAAIVLGFPSTAELERQVAKASPEAAVDYIRRTKLPGPMLNEYVFGDYLTWALPEEKVFVDGNADIFEGAGVLQQYGRWALLEEDPVLLLDKYKIRFCLLSRNAPMARVLPYLAGWKSVYRDDVAVVFAR